MKHLKSYNESVRDMMRPKSKEEIEQTLADYLPHEIMRLGYREQMWDLVRKGIENGASVHMENDAALLSACSHGNLDMVEYLVSKGANIRVNEDDCLVKACYSGNLELLKFLVEEGCDIHTGQIEKVLRAACSSGHPDMVEYLLGQGADQRKIVSADVTHGKNRRVILDLLNGRTNESVRDQMTPMTEEEIRDNINRMTPEEKFVKGFVYGMYDVARKGLEEGYRPSEVEKRQRLYYAIEKADLEKILFLLSIGTKVPSYAYKLARKKLWGTDRLAVSDLLKNGRHLHESVRDQMTPKSKEEINRIMSNMTRKQKNKLLGERLRKACTNRWIDEVRELLEMGADPNYDFDETHSPSTWNPLLFAIIAEDVECAKLLISYGAKVRPYHFDEVNKPEWYKNEKSKKEMLKLLNQNTFKGKFKRFIGMNESLRDKMTGKSESDIVSSLKGMNPNEKLILSAINDYLVGVKEALADGADIHYRDERALGEASKEGHIEIVRYLLDNGADVHGWYDYAMKWASSNNHNEVVRLLVEHGADVNTGNGDPLRSAIIHKNKELEKYLVDNGAIPEKVLDWSAGVNALDVMRYLLDKYPDIDIHYKNESILSYAVMMRFQGAVRFLVEHGADPSKLKPKDKNDYDELMKSMMDEETEDFIVRESVRDRMTPKSESQIKRELNGLPATKVFSTAKKNGVDIHDLYTEKEIRDLKDRVEVEFREEMREMKRKMTKVNDSYKGHITEIMEDNGTDYQIELNFPGNILVYIRKKRDDDTYECGYELEPMGETKRKISDWEETEDVDGCIDVICSWLDNHVGRTVVNESANLKCVDCGGKTETYFVKDKIWYDNVPRYKQRGSMCLSCLEKRVGRKLRRDDFQKSDIHQYQDWYKNMNESVRDKMTPVSDDKIKKARKRLVKKSLLEKLEEMYQTPGLAHVFSREELINEFKRLSKDEKREINFFGEANRLIGISIYGIYKANNDDLLYNFNGILDNLYNR